MAKRKPLARAVDPAVSAQARSGRPVPAPLAPPVPPAHEAVLLFQRGMEALQRHAYTEAAPAFQAIVMGYPAERAILDRARVYLGICERESKKRPASANGPLTLEERLTAATAALNNGEDLQAEELARGVLGDDPKHDLALYLLAAIHARRGASADALDLLSKVIAISPEASAQARSDEDFSSLHDDDAFWRLTEPPIVSSGNARRRSRGA
jgi:tetratricopeptide (TPR) repeat protein